MKTLLSLASVLLAIAFVSSACVSPTAPGGNSGSAAQPSGGPESSASATSAASTGSAASGSGEKISIEVVSGDAVELPPNGENFADIGISEALGIDFKYTILGAGNDYATALNVRLTAGDVPDIFSIPNISAQGNVRNKQNMRQYADNGILMSLTPYMERLKPVFDFTGGLRTADMYGDQLYLLPKVVEEPADVLVLRKDWLEALGLNYPTTPQELLDVCIAFTRNDPDGNGKPDTYGFSGDGLSTFNSILYPYDATVANDLLIRDGKLISSLESPYMKEGLAMAKAFVDAGVVDPDIISNTTSVSVDKGIQGLYGMSAAYRSGLLRPSAVDQFKAVNPNGEWMWFDALTGPAGKKFSYFDVGNTQSRFVTGKHVEEDPAKLEKVLDLFNFMVSEEGQRLVCYGAEGRHYNIESGKVVPTELMNTESNFLWAYQMAGRDNLPYLKTKFPSQSELLDFILKYPYFEVYNGAVMPPEGFHTEDFNRYVADQMTKFIFGQRPIDEYDVFLGELDSMFQFKAYMANAEQQLKSAGYLS